MHQLIGSLQPLDVGVIETVLQVDKLGFRDVKQFA